MNPVSKRLLIAALIGTSAAFWSSTPATADDEYPSCIYDREAGQFRALRVPADMPLLNETFAAVERPDFVMLGHKRFASAESIRSNPAELNPLLTLRGQAAGVQWFGTDDAYGDLVVALLRPHACLFAAYRYEPVIHVAWVEDLPFVFRYPALAVDIHSLRREGDRAFGTGFLMVGHPHPDRDPTVYVRQTVEADCARERMRVLDARSFAADNKLHEWYDQSDAWQASEAVTHPATRMLAHVACNIPAQWPDASRVQSLDELSHQVHTEAHRGG